MIEILHKSKKHFDIQILFLFCLLIYTYIVQNVPTDIQEHIQHSININSTETSYPANFLYYFILNFISGFSNDTFIIYLIAIVLLSTATVAKYVISKNIIIHLTTKDKKHHYDKRIYFIALGLFFCFAIPDPFSLFFLKKMYLGKFVPIVWHNSTTIMLFPIAILLFWKQLQVFDQLHKTSMIDILFINILVILNIIIKPSFIFTYAPVTFFFLLFRIKADTFKIFILKLTPLFTAALFILIQYYSIYKLQKGSIQKESSGILISSPFEVLSHWIPIWFIPISIVLSFTLPICSMIFFKEIIKYKPFLFSLCLTIVGIFISAFIMESGPRMFHGNFMWQNIICAYLLFLTTICFLTPKFINEKLRTKQMYILISIFVIHSLSGVLYLIKIVTTTSFR